jgi:hypothetical protein
MRPAHTRDEIQKRQSHAETQRNAEKTRHTCTSQRETTGARYAASSTRAARHDVGAVLDEAHQERGAEGVVDHQVCGG